jgi:hypothetical protein
MVVYLLNNVVVDLASGNVVVAVEREIHEALVVAQIKISFAAVIKNKHLQAPRRGIRSAHFKNKTEHLPENKNKNDDFHLNLNSCGTVTHLTVLERGHGASIDVDVGVDLDRSNPEAQRAENDARGARDYALAQTGENTARNQHILDHGVNLCSSSSNRDGCEMLLKLAAFLRSGQRERTSLCAPRLYARPELTTAQGDAEKILGNAGVSLCHSPNPWVVTNNKMALQVQHAPTLSNRSASKPRHRALIVKAARKWTLLFISRCSCARHVNAERHAVSVSPASSLHKEL